MKAKCPYCENGCERCENGCIEVGFAEGNWFTTVCLNTEECGFVNGGHITKDEFPSRSSGKCTICGGPTEWRRFEDAPEEEAWRKPENYNKFRVVSLERSVEQLVKKVHELQEKCLDLLTPDHTITVKEAQLMNCCRICKKKVTAPFTLNYGQEFAHTKCLELEEHGMSM